MTRTLRAPIASGLAAVFVLFAAAVGLQTLRDGRFALETSDEC